MPYSRTRRHVYSHHGQDTLLRGTARLCPSCVVAIRNDAPALRPQGTMSLQQPSEAVRSGVAAAANRISSLASSTTQTFTVGSHHQNSMRPGMSDQEAASSVIQVRALRSWNVVTVAHGQGLSGCAFLKEREQQITLERASKCSTTRLFLRQKSFLRPNNDILCHSVTSSLKPPSPSLPSQQSSPG